MRRYFWDALALLAPELYEAAGTDMEPVWLEQELPKGAFDMGGGALPMRMNRYKNAAEGLFGQEPVGIALIVGRRPKGEGTFYHSKRFGTEVVYRYINADVSLMPDALLLQGENRVARVLYAAKLALKSGKNEEARFQSLCEVAEEIWVKRRSWSFEDKEFISRAAEYLLRPKGDYKGLYADYMAKLKKFMKKEDKKMYKSVLEDVYRDRGRAEGRTEGRLEGRAEGRTEGRLEGRLEGRAEGRLEAARNFLANGVPPDIVIKSSGLDRDTVLSLMKP
ncbi:MAG: hypothetical protein LBR38_06890 [Synergistaceae bacterium]|nr:hypothetical protein [Synergistaceae bacterium]